MNPTLALLTRQNANALPSQAIANAAALPCQLGLAKLTAFGLKRMDFGFARKAAGSRAR